MGDLCKTPDCGRPVWVAKHGLCSSCYNRGRYHGRIDVRQQATQATAKRIWTGIKWAGLNDCWEWQGKSLTKGYGSVYDSVTRKRVLVHRRMWEAANGPIPDGCVIMHTCDNRLCCNPSHLRVGTQADNVRDMDEKRRRVVVVHRGEKHHGTKITANDVREIRAANNHKLDASFAQKFGMSAAGIKQIRLGRTWKHVT